MLHYHSGNHHFRVMSSRSRFAKAAQKALYDFSPMLQTADGLADQELDASADSHAASSLISASSSSSAVAASSSSSSSSSQFVAIPASKSFLSALFSSKDIYDNQRKDAVAALGSLARFEEKRDAPCAVKQLGFAVKPRRGDTSLPTEAKLFIVQRLQEAEDPKDQTLPRTISDMLSLIYGFTDEAECCLTSTQVKDYIIRYNKNKDERTKAKAQLGSFFVSVGFRLLSVDFFNVLSMFVTISCVSPFLLLSFSPLHLLLLSSSSFSLLLSSCPLVLSSSPSPLSSLLLSSLFFSPLILFVVLVSIRRRCSRRRKGKDAREERKEAQTRRDGRRSRLI
jgi:hypothetical protein